MAQIVLGMATSHAPSLNGSIDRFAEAGQRDMANPSGGLRPMKVDIEAMVREKASWIGKELTPEVWERRHAACQRAVDALGDVLDRVAPDVAVVIGDDTYEVFNPDKHIPAIDVFWGDSFLHIAHDSRRSASKDPHILRGQPELGWHFVGELNHAGFDVSHSRELPEG